MKFLVLIIMLSIATTGVAKDYSGIFKTVDPAVVQIFSTESAVELISLDDVATTSSEVTGSGVIIGKDGLILTAAQVVHSAEKVIVELNDKRRYYAQVISSVQQADLALIRILTPPENLTAIKPSDSDLVEIGEEVFVIGAPYGLKHTLTVGHLSGRRLSSNNLFGMELEFLQTDAAINQGNSGGPIFSKSGKLIGIVSYLSSKDGGNEGLGFAASTNMAKRILLDNPPIWSGINFLPLTAAMLRLINIPKYTEGLLIQHVAHGSLGAKFGLKPGMLPIEFDGHKLLLGGDIIVEVNSLPISTNRQGWSNIQQYMNSVKSGEMLDITIMREGTTQHLTTVKP